MGEKIEKKNGGEKAAPADGAGGKKDSSVITVVLKLDLHCEGCAKKVRRSVRHFEGVENVKADWESGKLMVMGNMDPVLLRERVESKTKKKVELVSPQPKKDGGSGGGGDKKTEEKSEKKAEVKKSHDNKPKEAPVSTVVMKIRLHCDGCARKIKRTISKNIGGVTSVSTDVEKNSVTVTGTMDAKELIAYLQEKLKRSVEIISPTKANSGDGDKAKQGFGDKKEKEGGGDKKAKEGGGVDKNEKEGGGEKKDSDFKAAAPAGGDGAKSEATKVGINKMEFHGYNPQTYYAMPMYNQSYANQGYGMPMYHQAYANTGHVVQNLPGPPPPPPTYLNIDDHMFSDENPNGCFIM